MQTNITVLNEVRGVPEHPHADDLWRAMIGCSELPLVVVRQDDAGVFRVVEVNEACQPYAILPWHQAPGCSVAEVAVPEIAEYIVSRLQRCAETGLPQSYERAVDFPSGRKCWATNLVPVHRPGEPTRTVICMMRPIPVDMHASGIEERNRVLFEGLMAADPGIIYIYDGLTKRVSFASGNVDRLLGLKPYQLEEMADPIGTLAHPDDRARFERTLQDIGTAEQPPGTVESRMRHRDGSYRRLSFHNRVLDQGDLGGWRLIGVATDVTDRALLKEEVAALNAQLASAQLTERRLIAQELHDSAGQYLIAAKLSLAGARERCPELGANLSADQLLDDVMQCLNDADREIRVLSYVLCPPAAGNQALATVLRNLVLGFGGRSGIRVDVSIDSKVNRVEKQLSVPIIRICQEALTNVHRHARATMVSIRLEVLPQAIELEIRDDGVGFSSDRIRKSPGLGLPSMRERVKSLGGTLGILSDKGTRVKATIPLS